MNRLSSEYNSLFVPSEPEVPLHLEPSVQNQVNKREQEGEDEVRRQRFLRMVSGRTNKENVLLNKKAQHEMDVMLEIQEKSAVKPAAELSESDLQSFISEIIAAANPEQIKQHILDIKIWLAEVDGEERFKRKNKVHEIIAKAIRSGTLLRLPILVLLGETDQLREELMNQDDLTDTLEINVDIHADAYDQLAALVETNSPQGNVLVHKILDFAQTHLSTLEKLYARRKRCKAMVWLRFG